MFEARINSQRTMCICLFIFPNYIQHYNICYFQIKVRLGIIQQLRELKALKDDNVMSDEQFDTEREKLTKKLSSLDA